MVDSRVLGRQCGGGREGVIGFELHHGPNDHPCCGQNFLQEWELRQQVGFDAFACFIAGPESVAKGLDHVIGRDTDVGGASLSRPNKDASTPRTAPTSRPWESRAEGIASSAGIARMCRRSDGLSGRSSKTTL